MKRNTLISFEIKQENLEKIRLHMARTTKEQIAFYMLNEMAESAIARLNLNIY